MTFVIGQTVTLTDPMNGSFPMCGEAAEKWGLTKFVRGGALEVAFELEVTGTVAALPTEFPTPDGTVTAMAIDIGAQEIVADAKYVVATVTH